jgi:urease accessory protein
MHPAEYHKSCAMRGGADPAMLWGAVPHPRAAMPSLSYATPHDPASPLATAAGQGSLAIVRSGNASVVARSFATSPLRLLTPANHGHGAWIYTSNHGAGLVDSDRLTLDVEVGPGATAFISSQASTKVYRSPAGTGVKIDARVGADAILILAPDPVVPFAGSNYRQVQRFQLEPGGMLVVADALVAGRCAAGERWAFSEYRGQTEIRVGRRLLVHDALVLRPDDGVLERRFGRFDVLTTMFIVGPGLSSEAESLLAAIERQPVRRHADLILTASRLARDGCVVRLLATSVERAVHAVRGLLRFVPAWLGDDPWSRKW